MTGRLGSIAISTALVLAFVRPTYGDSLEVGGHAKYQISIQDFDRSDLSDVLGPERPVSHEIDLRFNASQRIDALTFVAEGEFLGLGTDGLATRDMFDSFSVIPGVGGELADDDRRLFDLSRKVIDDEKFDGFLRFDRLFTSYSYEALVLIVGRQSISWGNGLLFQAIDPYNPFSPAEIDKDYKTGDDMLYTQWLFDSGDDLQAIAIPRRDPSTNSLQEEESSFALKYHGRIDALLIDYDLLASRHFEEWLYGLGVSGEVLEAIWRFDVSLIDLRREQSALSMVANIDYSWVLFGKNFYAFLEYFYSGVGTSKENYSMPAERLVDRIARGELFTLGRNYLGIGGRFEATPLVNTYLNHFVNIGDSSGLVQLRIVYDILQDVAIQIGADIPYGSRGTEFGGIPLADGSFLAPGERAYLRTSYYF